MNYSTDSNKPGVKPDGKKLKDLQSFITRTAPLFGLQVLSFNTFKPLDRVNIDSIYSSIKKITDGRRKNFHFPGQASDFIKLSKSIGAVFS
jgi:hypothetical protein